MVNAKTRTVTPAKYRPYLAYWQQQKAEAQDCLKTRHQAGLQQAKELADVLKSEFGVTKVVLFGSMLSVNEIHLHSDIDLAVWDLPSEQHISALGKLLMAAGEFSVDLVRIEEAPPSLKNYILKDGLILGATVPSSDEITQKSMPMAKHDAFIKRLKQTLRDIESEYDYARSQAVLAKETKQDVYWTAAGMGLHGFYTGLEKAFGRIAEKIDGGLDGPKTGQWHKDLLDQMAREIPNVRPPVIDEKTRQRLNEYLSFRHVIRSNYTHRLDPEKIAENFYRMEECYVLVTQQLNDFCEFLALVD